MKKYDNLDQILKQALSPTVKPSRSLNHKIINELNKNVIAKQKENNHMKFTYKKISSHTVVAAAIVLIMSISAFAAFHILKPKQIAEHFGMQTLADEFEHNSVEINQSVVSNGYNFTLQGIVSGEGLIEFEKQEPDINPKRSYAVVSITKEDGSKMSDTMDEEYGQEPFFISPLIKGQKPWRVNITSMKGGYWDCVIDGVMYRLIECDGLGIFADRGVYLCISNTDFYDGKAFDYNENTGEVSPNTNYTGVNIIFDLPLNEVNANHDKAEKYLNELLK